MRSEPAPCSASLRSCVFLASASLTSRSASARLRADVEIALGILGRDVGAALLQLDVDGRLAFLDHLLQLGALGRRAALGLVLEDELVLELLLLDVLLDLLGVAEVADEDAGRPRGRTARGRG